MELTQPQPDNYDGAANIFPASRVRLPCALRAHSSHAYLYAEASGLAGAKGLLLLQES